MARTYEMTEEKFNLLRDYFSRYLREYHRSGADLTSEMRVNARRALNELWTPKDFKNELWTPKDFKNDLGAMQAFMDAWIPPKVQQKAKLAVRQRRNAIAPAKHTKTMRVTVGAFAALGVAQDRINSAREDEGQPPLNRSEIIEQLCDLARRVS